MAKKPKTNRGKKASGKTITGRFTLDRTGREPIEVRLANTEREY